MTVVAFRLIAVDESAPALSTLANVLPVEWNKSGPGHYTFRYRHEQSSLEFVMKIAKLGGRTLINAIAVEVRAQFPALGYPDADFSQRVKRSLPWIFPLTILSRPRSSHMI